MPDTDDDQTIALEAAQHEPGDDDTGSASERRARALRQQPNERLAAVTGLTAEEEEARRLDELDEARAEDLELTDRDERELEESRQRRETLDVSAAATTEVQEAFRLADIADATSERHRGLANTERQHALSDQARGGHKLDEAAAGWDQPGAAGLAASGRRDQRAAGHEANAATEHDIIADKYADKARKYREEGQEAQPPATDAVRNPPATPPEARIVRHNEVRRKKRTPSTPDRSTEPDIGLGD